MLDSPTNVNLYLSLKKHFLYFFHVFFFGTFHFSSLVSKSAILGTWVHVGVTVYGFTFSMGAGQGGGRGFSTKSYFIMVSVVNILNIRHIFRTASQFFGIKAYNSSFLPTKTVTSKLNIISFVEKDQFMCSWLHFFI